MAWDADGTLLATEFGPGVDDEINRIVPDGNDGWPVVNGVSQAAPSSSTRWSCASRRSHRDGRGDASPPDDRIIRIGPPR